MASRLTKRESVEHPAKFSREVLAVIRELLETYPFEGEVLDPFAGVGRVHELRQDGYQTLGVELEPEWVNANPELTQQGDATDLPAEWSGRFGAVVTSPPYGNRLADNYAGDAKGSRRHTYRISLKRPLTKGSAAGLQWGDAYRGTMRAALWQIKRVLRPGGLFVLNISDHVRAGQLQQVPEWYERVIVSDLHLQLVERREVVTRRNRDGANAELRAPAEIVYVFRVPSGGTV